MTSQDDTTVIFPYVLFMPVSFLNTYKLLGEAFYSPSQPQRVPHPRLILWNKDLADELGIESDNSTQPELTQIFSGNRLPPSSFPIALVYAGHQFAHFVPQLGDGRALLLGELKNKTGNVLEVQLKGSGPTKFSRNGDGKSALGPVIREYLVSEAMYALGIPTTRSLAAIASGEKVFREAPLDGGVLTRIASSHVRVGTFEYFAYRNDTESLNKLVDFCIDRHFPSNQPIENSATYLFENVIHAQAELLAQWMGVGFIHGVMNTDNCAIGGFTIDYGPCAFMDGFNYSQVYSYIDRQGRYAFGNQPSIALWNLERFAECLLPLLDSRNDKEKKMLESILANFSKLFKKHFISLFAKKMGISQEHPLTEELIHRWLNILNDTKSDFTLSFRWLSHWLEEPDKRSPDVMEKLKIETVVPESEALKSFKKDWLALIQQQNLPQISIAEAMKNINPILIPRNHIVEQVIADAYNGNFDSAIEFSNVLKKPYQFSENHLNFYLPPKEDQVVKNTFCGT